MREIWDLYDENKNVTGLTMLRGDPVPKGYYCLSTDALFLNSKGETLLQLRSREKAHHPGIWYTTGGAVEKGEDSRHCCVREVEEELGFTPDMEHGSLVWTEKNDQKGCIMDVYLFHQDMPLSDMKYQAEEVQDALWILPEDISKDQSLWSQVSQVCYWDKFYPYLCLESMRVRIPEGVYRHYKGNRYQVKGLAIHSETLEPMVVYQALYGAGETWVRPASMWNETVLVNGRSVPRFAPEEEK